VKGQKGKRGSEIKRSKEEHSSSMNESKGQIRINKD
jgi:hypothetical protein